MHVWYPKKMRILLRAWLFQMNYFIYAGANVKILDVSKNVQLNIIFASKIVLVDQTARMIAQIAIALFVIYCLQQNLQDRLSALKSTLK